MKEKLNAKVLFDEDTYTRFLAEVPKVCEFNAICLSFKTGLLHINIHQSHVYIIYCICCELNCNELQMKLVTPSSLVERLKINMSLARAACKFFAEVGG